jgi:hypothetical protein
MTQTKEEAALRAWNSRLGRVFGISKDDYIAIVRLQGGQCPLCGKSIPDPELPGEARRFPVDHDHKSGEVRGIPCEFCNRRRIGQWNSTTVETLRRLLDYIDNPPARRHFGRPLIVPGHGVRKRRKRRKPVS